MAWLKTVRYRFRTVTLRLRIIFRRHAADAETDEELAFHVEQEIEKNLRAGMTPPEARRQALIAFGGMDRIKEQVRDARGLRPLEDLARDLRYALRQFRRAPFFTFVAILTLTIGIGANTGIFSVVNGFLLRDRPYQAPEDLVHVYSSVEGRSAYGTAYARDLPDLRALEDVFQAVGAFAGKASRIMAPEGVRMVLVEAVTADLFPLVGLEMELGRGFSLEEDEEPGAHPVAVLGHSLWQRRFGEDPSVLGQSLQVGGQPFTIVGVAPAEFESFTAQGFQADLFVPMGMAASLEGERDADRAVSIRGPEGWKIIGRLREGVSIDQAQGRVDGLSRSLRVNHPDLYESRSFLLFPSRGIALQPDLDAFFMSGAALLMTAVGLVLLLACVNLASFLLARGVDRKKEIALRLTLGARRGRLVRQLLTETLTLGLIGAITGIFAARWCLDLLTSLSPAMALPLNIDTGLDSTVLLFTLGMAGGVGVLAGLAPALQSTSPDLAPTLKEGAGGKGGQRRGLRNALVALQMALSVVLLVAGGLFVRSMHAAQGVDPGFDTREAALLWLDLEVSGIPRNEWGTLVQTLKEEAEALPGMEIVATSNGIQLSEAAWQGEFDLPGATPPPDGDFHHVSYLAVGPSFLEAMGIPLVAGRGFAFPDRSGAEPVAVVSQTAVEHFWPTQNPLGREIRLQGEDTAFRVVGVARDTKVVSRREGPTPLFYFLRSQFQRRTSQLWLVARGVTSPAETVGQLRGLVRDANPNLVVVQARTMNDHLAASLFLPRVGAFLLGSFGLLALALATVGLYGVVSYTVSRRTREVGIRMALGAGRTTVVKTIVREALGTVLIGGAVGLVASLGVVRFLGGYLTGVGPYDPVTFVAVPLLLIAVSTMAAFIPARFASKVNPVRALRAE